LDSSAGQKFEKLISIMARLRAPDGCPWDREQTFDTIKPYLLEEAYEVMEAIDARDWRELAEELGDLMLQSVFFAQMASEAGYFSIEDSIDAINNKLIRRHPHIFGDSEAHTADDVKKRWDEIKAEEKKAKGESPKLLLESIPRSLPALVEAAQISSRAARAGFDWENAEQVLEKLEEELHELSEAREQASQDEIEGEVGDLLFVLVNLARFVKVDPEQALRKSNAKFRRRFAHIERSLQSRGRTLGQSNVQEMEEIWQEAKRSE
jgi:tetrapyrrole methylase family protein/MazG family protein